MDGRVSRQLTTATRRFRSHRRAARIAITWSVLALGLFGVWSIQQNLSENQINALTSGAIAIGLVVTVGLLWPRKARHGEQLVVARLIESRFPDLNQRLLTAVEQSPDPESGRFNVIQEDLIREVQTHSYTHPWQTCISRWRLWGRRTAALLALIVFWGLHSNIEASRPDPTGVAGHEESSNDGNAVGSRFSLKVVPGEAEVERGTSLTITARFDGPLPASVALVRNEASGETATVVMQKSLKDPVFGMRIASVRRDFEYRIQFDDESSEPFSITVYELPRVDQIDAQIEYPSYASMPKQLIEDAWQIAAVEGSTAMLFCRLNKEIASGKLVDGAGAEWQLKRVAEKDVPKPTNLPVDEDGEAASLSQSKGIVYSARIPIDCNRTLTFDLADDKGRKNRDPSEFRIEALANRPPEIKLTFPGRDMQVSPIEELQLEASVWDDFGLKQHGIILSVADQAPKMISLGEEAAGRQQHQLAHLIELELTGAAPNDLVSYYFFADDMTKNGKSRRTSSDMFFAEVRHFEEIFREAQQQPGGQQQQQQQGGGQNAQQAEKLAELQKQIMTATWNIIRREVNDDLTESFGDDVKLLIESQTKAQEQLGALVQKLQDAQSKNFAESVAKFMQQSVERLTRSAEEKQVVSLNEALASERSAYQALLKLRAREHRVMKSQSGGGGGGGGGGANRSQQQLQQLELDNRKNRYEAERQAGSQTAQRQQQQNREQLQVLNRLRELSRRQGDLNRKLRELEHALRAAKNEQEKEEIERQLKRLRDEQREMLRDVDELKNRMEQPNNQQQMADSREKIDQTRQRVRQASQALEGGRLSQALSAGTRAERELDQLKNDFRQKAAGQFGEQMRDLRQQAREIGERQDQLADVLNRNESKQNPSLRSGVDREDITKKIDDQKKQVDKVLDDMKKVVEKAETSEPLLARQLYEAVRKARADRANDALDETQRLVGRGLMPQAADAEKLAHKGIDRLQDGIERAADSVLGNELDSLRRARQELDGAGESIARELAQADPSQRNQLPAEYRDRKQEDNRNGESRKASDGTPIRNSSGNQQQPGQQNRAGQQKDEAQQRQNASGQQRNQDGQQPGQRAAQSQQQSQRNQNQQGNSQRPNGQQPQSGQQGNQPGKRNQNQQNQNQPGQQSGQRNQAGQPQQQPGQQSGSPSQQPGQQSQTGQRPGQSPQQPGQQSPSQQPGQPSQPGQRSQSGQPGQQSSRNQNSQSRPGSQRSHGQPGLRTRQSPQAPGQAGEIQERSGQGAFAGNPLTGPGFREWSDRMRDVEELVDDPKLRAEVARIREQARSVRAEFKRHSKEPEWDLVRTKILEPLTEVRQRIREEIAKRESPDSLVPIDRDPVPDRYADLVRRYNELIGSGK